MATRQSAQAKRDEADRRNMARLEQVDLEDQIAEQQREEALRTGPPQALDSLPGKCPSCGRNWYLTGTVTGNTLMVIVIIPEKPPERAPVQCDACATIFRLPYDYVSKVREMRRLFWKDRKEAKLPKSKRGRPGAR